MRKLRVFLCHASTDKPIVREIYLRLTAEDWIDPWLDSAKLLPGQHWRMVIQESLNRADAVIIFVSNNSINREGFVQREMNYAWDRSLEKPRSVIYLIPIRLEECDVPDDLRERQWADYFGKDREETYKALLQSLRLRYEQRLRLEEEESAREKRDKELKDIEEKSRLEAEESNQRAKEEEERVRRETEERDRKKAEARKQVEERARKEAEERKTRDNNELAQVQAEKKALQNPGKGSIHTELNAKVESLNRSDRGEVKRIGTNIADFIKQAKPEISARRVSGLVRVMSPYSAFVYNILTMGLIFPWMYLWAPGSLPGGSLVWGIILAMLFELPIAFVYVWLSTALPRSGGDYVFQSRVFGGGLAFTVVMSGFVIWILQWVALSGWLVSYLGFAPLFLGLGATMGSAALSSLGIWFTTSTAIVVVSIISALVSLILLVSGFKNYIRFQHVMWWATLLCFATVFIVLFTTPASEFISRLNAFAVASGGAPNWYQTALAATTKAGIDVHPPFSLLATLLVAPIAWTSLQWATYSAQQNGEIKNARSFRSQVFIMVGSLIAAGLLLALLAVEIQRVAGSEFLYVAGAGYWSGISASNINGFNLWPPILAIALTASPLVVLIIASGYLLNGFQVVCYCYIGMTRVLVAMSLDRLLPEWFSKVDEKLHTPVNAHLAYFLASVLVILAYNLVGGWVALTLGVTFGNGYVFVVTCIAGALLPYRAKALYEASPGAKYKLGNMPLVTVLGVLGGMLGTFMVFAILFVPALGVLGNWDFTDFPAHVWAQIFAIGIIVVSWMWYVVAKNNRKSKGIDVDFAFKEIPPE